MTHHSKEELELLDILILNSQIDCSIWKLQSLIKSLDETEKSKYWEDTTKGLKDIVFIANKSKFFNNMLYDELQRLNSLSKMIEGDKDLLFKLNKFSMLEEENKRLKEEIQKLI